MSTPHRLLFVITSSDIGGAEISLEHLVGRLDRTRFAPTVVSLRPIGRVGRRIAATGTPVRSFELSSSARLRESLGAVARLRRWIDELEIDLVHSMLYRANAMSSVAARLSRSRPVVMLGERSLTPMGGLPARVAAALTRPLSDHMVTVSEAVAREVRGRWRGRPGRVSVIPNGVDTERFRPRDRNDARGRIGVARKGLVVGAVGRLAAEKGLGYLLSATAPLAPHVVLAIVGEGPLRQELMAMARELDLGERVLLLGRRDDLEWIYPAFDLFVLPSLEEGLPNALLEAMACGCACVATRVGGVPEVAASGSVELVEPASADGLTRAMSGLLVDPERRHELGRRARRRVESAFSVETMVTRYEELFTSMLRTDR